MSKKSKLLVRRISELVESSVALRELLVRYERANINLAKLIERGEPAATSLMNLKSPLRRREMTERLQDFEAARHQVRLALFALCLEEGATMSEVGRVLGISRQLASRLANEAEEADS
jgi:transposase-like protein